MCLSLHLCVIVQQLPMVSPTLKGKFSIFIHQNINNEISVWKPALFWVVYNQVTPNVSFPTFMYDCISTTYSKSYPASLLSTSYFLLRSFQISGSLRSFQISGSLKCFHISDSQVIQTMFVFLQYPTKIAYFPPPTTLLYWGPLQESLDPDQCGSILTPTVQINMDS